MSSGLTLNSYYHIKEGYKIWLVFVFLSIFTGIILTAVWTFNYGVTTQDIETHENTSTNQKLEILIAGSVLTTVFTLILVITLVKLHSNHENTNKLVNDNVTTMYE